MRCQTTWQKLIKWWKFWAFLKLFWHPFKYPHDGTLKCLVANHLPSKRRFYLEHFRYLAEALSGSCLKPNFLPHSMKKAAAKQISILKLRQIDVDLCLNFELAKLIKASSRCSCLVQNVRLSARLCETKYDTHSALCKFSMNARLSDSTHSMSRTAA